MAVGTPLGAERGPHRCNRCPLMLQHVGDDGITPDQEPVRLDLTREMPVAEMPGEAREVIGIAPADLQKFLLGRADDDLPPIFKGQPVTVGEHRCMGEIDEHGQSTVRHQNASSQMPGRMIEGQAVHRLPLWRGEGAGDKVLGHVAPRFMAAVRAGLFRRRSK